MYKATDARGVETSFSYSNRHLVTGISYSSPAGITQTAPVSLSYDAAGNRTSLIDGSGSKSYQYDQLSRLISEIKQFTGLSSSYTLSYGHNLGDNLTIVTDPTGASIGYGYDQAGRMTGVTSYATNVQYKAWGAVKSAAYGGNRSLSASYNSRLIPMNVLISSTNSKHYEYNADGRLRYSRNNGAGMFDRSYTYDHLGRVIEATSGPKARGEADTDQRPYNLSYGYDELNHLLQSVGRVWEYLHKTNTGWQYDADGRLVNSDETQYFVTSSVLNQVVTELDENGAKTRTFVYQGKEVLAWQQQSGSTQTIAWEHRDMSNTSVTISGLAEGSKNAELEPLGMNAGAFHLIAPPPPAYRPTLKGRGYPGFADSTSSQCRVDFIDTPCGIGIRL